MYDVESGWTGNGFDHEEHPRYNHNRTHNHHAHVSDDESEEFDRRREEALIKELLEKFRHEQMVNQYLSNPWAILWKSTFWLISVCLACHMLYYAQNIVSGFLFLWTLRAFLVVCFLVVAQIMRDVGLSWKSILILGYVIGAYYLFLGIPPRTSGFIRIVLQIIAMPLVAFVGFLAYANYIFDETDGERRPYEGISAAEMFEAAQFFAQR